MDGSLRIGRLFGIPILLHFTFLLIIPLLTWLIGTDIANSLTFINAVFGLSIESEMITQGYNPYILGFIVSCGLFFGVFIHELSHSLIALRSGIQIESITLLFFGGIAKIQDSDTDPQTEFRIALAGPVVSLLSGLLCIALLFGTGSLIQDNPPLTGFLMYIWGYLAILNILLFLFNLLPAFPMDGGRVLRAFLALRMPIHKATEIASGIGKGFAIIFGMIGLLIFSPILIMIAFFIYIGAGQESTATRYKFLLKDVRIQDIMSKPVISVTPGMSLTNIISLMYQTKHLGFPVLERSYLVGIITLSDLSRVPSIDREAMQVKDAMSPHVTTLKPEDSVFDALRIMTQRDIGRIPVLADGNLIGIITKSDIFTVIELKEM